MKNKNRRFYGKSKETKLKNELTPKKAPILLDGKIETHPDGYAFFIPEKGKDYFVPKAGINGALHGDKVRVKLTQYRGKMEAHVVEVLQHSITEIVGRVIIQKRSYLVVPFHRKFDYPIYVRKTDGTSYTDDEVVICKITKYPDARGRTDGEILKSLGRLTDKGIENSIVMSKYGLYRQTPTEILLEAEKAATNLPEISNNIGRHDFRDIHTITIDGENARDFDDAISIERTNDEFNLYVHIADVAHYVKPATELDNDAYTRGTSVYFPEFAIPMLPESLSNMTCSLRPNEDRFTITVRIKYNKMGDRIKTHFYQSIIRSNHRLTYRYVNDVLSGVEKADKQLLELITTANELMKIIKRRRINNGTIDFDLPDVDFIFDNNGDIVKITPEDRGISERIIENFMIEANEAVSEALEAKAPKSIFRNHDKPDFAKIKQWSKNIGRLGASVGRIPDDVTPEVVQKWFNQLENSPYSYMLKAMLVRSMQRAEYAAENIGHFGLSSESYTHFTSPIRRYPDLIIHRLMKKYLFGVDVNIDVDNLAIMARHCSERENNAENAEREVRLYKKLAYLRNNSDNVYDAYINRVMPDGFYVFLTELLMVGYVDVTGLPEGRYKFDTEDGVVYKRRGGIAYRLGESLNVRWVNTDWDKLEAIFMLA